MRGARFDAEYGGSWDPGRRALDGPLPVDEARRRHATGEPYAVLLGARGRPRVLLEVSAADGEVEAVCFDDRMRHAFVFEFELLGPDLMVLLRMDEWRYAGADQPDRARDAAHCTTGFGRNGEPEVELHGASGAGFRVLDRRDRWVEVPRFGEWAPLAAFLLGTRRTEGRRVVRPARRARPAPSGTSWCWEGVGGGPLRVGPEPATAFGPPARYALDPDGRGAAVEVVVETHPMGLLRLPTGRLLVADADHLHDGLEPFTVALPPGRHPMTLAVARLADEPGHSVVAAWRLDVRDAPVESWEPALRPGEDPGTLGEGGFFGTEVESGVLLVVDAAALPDLAAMAWVREGEPWGWWEELAAMARRHGGRPEPPGPDAEADLLPFPSGWGDGAYPAWIGRAADGDVACVVVDTLVLSGATLLGPARAPRRRRWWSRLVTLPSSRSDRQNGPGGPSWAPDRRGPGGRV